MTHLKIIETQRKDQTQSGNKQHKMVSCLTGVLWHVNL